MQKDEKPKFDKDLEMLKVTIMADHALGYFLTKFAGLLGATLAVMGFWYTLIFLNPSGKQGNPLDPGYYWGLLGLALFGSVLIIVLALMPYIREMQRLDKLIEGIQRQESVGRLVKPRWWSRWRDKGSKL